MAVDSANILYIAEEKLNFAFNEIVIKLYKENLRKPHSSKIF